eukprot:CAMPEP_0172359778 /NCGR_PEP_ID=MMETSP1060-20121228/3924_1 /TAXON_ID=37318 /ORGANISM="Pseudo-nitzschia pungens, Strain cf. cingulata" /LENGTH=600 /DNA_ID=CAMNT_0013081565 /DNA_START=203 /DNA_END=2005 /DNA_ORIENTATION=-
MISMRTSFTSTAILLRLLLFSFGKECLVRCQNNENRRIYLDRFTYENIDQYNKVNVGDGTHTAIDYSPDNWGDITCNEGSRLDECEGYRDKWDTGREWEITKNYCKWCPAGEGIDCGRHHQSPIDLKRGVGLDWDVTSPYYSEMANECIDLHWMKYEDSFCTLDQLEDSDAFTIERHALRIAQPISVYDDFEEDKDGVVDGIRLECRIKGRGSRFGRIDYSKGFSQWWHLSHIDIHSTSEHTQDGVRYDGEIQLQHFYSVPARETGTNVNNEMGTVSIFLKAYDNAPPYRYLDKVICQWRRKEYEVRKECGLDPIQSTYPGCFPLNRRRRKLRRRTSGDKTGSLKRHAKGFRTVHDVILYNDFHRDNPNHTDVQIHMEESNWDAADETIDWDVFVAEQSEKMNEEEELYHKMMSFKEPGGSKRNATDEELHEEYRRALLNYDEIPWHNYWPMYGVRTEYYFRYSGTQTIPPCYGDYDSSSRKGTNHWRVMKDPIRIHPRQLVELRRLIAERIAPKGDPVKGCSPDTAAKVKIDQTREPTDPGRYVEVNTARPLQSWDRVHFKTFCECKDWPSKWPEDRKWCQIDDMYERFYEKKYNFDAY